MSQLSMQLLGRPRLRYTRERAEANAAGGQCAEHLPLQLYWSLPSLGGIVPWSPQGPIAELLHAQRPRTVSEAFCRFDASLPALLLLCFSTRFPLTEIMSTMGLCGEDC